MRPPTFSRTESYEPYPFVQRRDHRSRLNENRGRPTFVERPQRWVYARSNSLASRLRKLSYPRWGRPVFKRLIAAASKKKSTPQTI